MIQFFTKKAADPVFTDKHLPKLAYVSYIDSVANTLFSRKSHKHEDILEILVVFTGSGQYDVNGTVYPISKGDVIACNPHVVHGDLPEHNQKLETFCLAYKEVQIAGETPGNLISLETNPIVHLQSEFDFVKMTCTTLYDLVTEAFVGPDDMTQLLGASLLAFFAAKWKSPDLVKQESWDHKQKTVLVRQIKNYIDNNFHEDLDLTKISQYFHINLYYLSHVFKELTDVTPVQYLISRRIGEAQTLLISTQKPITEIALMSGFGSASSFSALFLKQVGMPPSQFRKKYVTKPDPK